VEPQENIEFSDLLNSYNISHTMFLYPGSHRTVAPGFMECISTFRDNLCPKPNNHSEDVVKSSNDTKPYIIALVILSIFLVATLIAVAVIWFKRGGRNKYEPIRGST